MRQIRKVAKAKGMFINDMALLKLVYLASQWIAEKWIMPKVSNDMKILKEKIIN